VRRRRELTQNKQSAKLGVTNVTRGTAGTLLRLRVRIARFFAFFAHPTATQHLANIIAAR
jgi:hypothetical protein